MSVEKKTDHKIKHEHKRSDNEMELNKIMNDIKRLKRKQVSESIQP